jgi:hypothetical protein
MATFSTKKILYGSTSLIPTIAICIQEEFQNDGYEVVMETLSSGGYDISITKGGVFKAVLGLKTALKVTLLPQGNNINFEAGIGIFGKQIVPLIVMYFIGWPLLLTQIWGLVKQSKLDDKALAIAETIVYAQGNRKELSSNTSEYRFCTACGAKNLDNAKFCCGCGKPLS